MTQTILIATINSMLNLFTTNCGATGDFVYREEENSLSSFARKGQKIGLYFFFCLFWKRKEREGGKKEKTRHFY